MEVKLSECPLCGSDTDTLIVGHRACTNQDCMAYGKYPIPEPITTDQTGEDTDGS